MGQVLFSRGFDALGRAQELGGPLGPYVLQALIAACHARARRADDTDWIRIADLYDALARLAPSAVVEVNRAVAHGRAFGRTRALGSSPAGPAGTPPIAPAAGGPG